MPDQWRLPHHWWMQLGCVLRKLKEDVTWMPSHVWWMQLGCVVRKLKDDVTWMPSHHWWMQLVCVVRKLKEDVTWMPSHVWWMQMGCVVRKLKDGKSHQIAIFEARELRFGMGVTRHKDHPVHLVLVSELVSEWVSHPMAIFEVIELRFGMGVQWGGGFNICTSGLCCEKAERWKESPNGHFWS